MQVDGTQGVKATIFQRRSVRAYTTAQVGGSTIRELLLAAVQAPTAMHLEPWAFVVVQDTARLKRYSDRGRQMFLESARSTGLTNAGDPRAQAHLAMLADPAFDIFHGASTLIVVCRKTGGAFSDADCWLAAENLILAATAAGLGTCCIGFAVPVLNAPDVKRELGIPDAGAAVAPIVVGVPGATPPGVSRKEPDILAWLR